VATRPSLIVKYRNVNAMNRRGTFLAMLLATTLVALSAVSQSNPNGSQSFTGEIMDNLCAKEKTHSKMMEEMKSMGNDPAVCTRKCIQLGGKYVLYDREKDTVYALVDQDKAEPFAGRAVHISGTLDKKKIKIDKIEAADSASRK